MLRILRIPPPGYVSAGREPVFGFLLNGFHGFSRAILVAHVTISQVGDVTDGRLGSG
jgi:hypothetical protein